MAAEGKSLLCEVAAQPGGFSSALWGIAELLRFLAVPDTWLGKLDMTRLLHYWILMSAPTLTFFVLSAWQHQNI